MSNILHLQFLYTFKPFRHFESGGIIHWAKYTSSSKKYLSGRHWSVFFVLPWKTHSLCNVHWQQEPAFLFRFPITAFAKQPVRLHGEPLVVQTHGCTNPTIPNAQHRELWTSNIGSLKMLWEAHLDLPALLHCSGRFRLSLSSPQKNNSGILFYFLLSEHYTFRYSNYIWNTGHFLLLHSRYFSSAIWTL